MYWRPSQLPGWFDKNARVREGESLERDPRKHLRWREQIIDTLPRVSTCWISFASDLAAIQATFCQHLYLDSLVATNANISSPSDCLFEGPKAQKYSTRVIDSTSGGQFCRHVSHPAAANVFPSVLSCPVPILASGATGRQRDTNPSRHQGHRERRSST